jgi:hypothetical protein
VVLDAGHTYSFRMRAGDLAGNLEGYPAAAEAVTTIPSTLCSNPDSWETSGGKPDDNTASRATVTAENWVEQVHNLCNPSLPSHQDDEDWIKLDLPAGKTLLVSAIPLSESAAMRIELYAGDAATLLAQDVPQDFGLTSSVLYRAVQATTLYVRVRHLDGRVIGEGTFYRLRLVIGVPIFLPLLLN